LVLPSDSQNNKYGWHILNTTGSTYQCYECLNAWVSKPGEICKNCKTTICESCGEIIGSGVIIQHKQDKREIPQYKIICLTCSASTCRQCDRVTNYGLNSDGLCKSCSYGKGFADISCAICNRKATNRYTDKESDAYMRPLCKYHNDLYMNSKCTSCEQSLYTMANSQCDSAGRCTSCSPEIN
jgi:hypothetical protein